MEQVLIEGAWQSSSEIVGGFRAVDPATGEAIGPEFPRSGGKDIERALAAAVAVADELAQTSRERMGDFLERYASGIEAAAEELVASAHADTALPAPNSRPATLNPTGATR